MSSPTITNNLSMSESLKSLLSVTISCPFGNSDVFTPLKNVLCPTLVNLPLKSDFVTKVSEVLEVGKL